ncbi:MAG: MFS transporter [Chloroflexi bacterium]|nr:MFS transporter [Chloroflexota bacterium]
MNKVLTPPTWLSRDATLIVSARAFRAFGQGMFSVLAAVYLHLLGFEAVRIGLFLSVGVMGGVFYTLTTIFAGDSFGRKRLLVIYTVLMGASAAAIAASENYGVLLTAAFLGGMNAAGGGGGPALPLEQAALAGTVPSQRRTDLYALYGVVGTIGGAVGALAVGTSDLLQGWFSLDQRAIIHIMLFVFSAALLVNSFFYALLSPRVEAGTATSRWVNPFRLPSRKILFTLSGLFSVDHFAGNLIPQSLVALWFLTKFGVALGEIGMIFFATNILAAVSLWVAAKLANRIGLINTMVFTHIPASLLLIAIPFLPTMGLVAFLWLVRGFFGMMDVPTRQSYTMAVVSQEERGAMAGLSSLSGSIVGAFGPSVATALWSLGVLGLPFIACGVLKIGYDLSLFTLFRRVKPPEEQG